MIKNIIYIGVLIPFLISCNSEDWTEDRKAEAIGYCTSSGNPKGFCECSVDILVTIVTYDEFSHWNSEILDGKHPSGDVVSKMMGVGKRVADECRSK